MKKSLMLGTISALLFFNACRQSQALPEVVRVEKTPEISLRDLTLEQRAKLDKNLPPEVREVLDNTEELEILVRLNKETKQLEMLGADETTNTVAKITDASLKKAILDSFYFDTAVGDGADACWAPRHKLKAKHEGKTVDLIICFECNWYKGSGSSGKIYGTLNYKQNKSLPLITQAIEKYGVDVR